MISEKWFRWEFVRFRRNRRRRGMTTCIACQLEGCEQRLLPAGTVTASLSGRNFVVTGDNQGNVIDVQVTSDGATVVGLEGTRLKFNGIVFPADEPLELFGEPILPRDLTVKLKGGNDRLVIRVGDDFGFGGPDAQVGRNVKFDLGSGDDDLLVELGTGNLSVRGKAEFLLGTGNDNVLIHATPGGPLINVAKSLKVSGNAGNDVVSLWGVSVGQGLSIDTGSGDDVCEVWHVDVGQDLNLKLGGGNDASWVDDVIVSGRVFLDAGSGNDRSVLDSVDLRRGGEQKMSGGNDVLVVVETEIAAGTTLKLDGGSGSDLLHRDVVDLSKLRVTGFETVTDTRFDLYDDITDFVANAVNDALDKILGIAG